MEGLHHVALLCAQKEPTVAFYEALGFALRESRVREDRQDEIIWMEQKGVTLEIFAAKNHPDRPSSPEAYGLRHLALRTKDAKGEREKLVKMGYHPEPLRQDAFTQENMFFIKDPDGLPIEIHE